MTLDQRAPGPGARRERSGDQPGRTGADDDDVVPIRRGRVGPVCRMNVPDQRPIVGVERDERR